MERFYSIASASVARWNSVLRGLLVLGLALALVLLTHSAQGSVVSRHAAAPQTPQFHSEPLVLSQLDWMENFPSLNVRLRCEGTSARPKLKTVQPCQDVFDAQRSPWLPMLYTLPANN